MNLFGAREYRPSSYSIRFAISTRLSTLIDINPDTLRLRSKGQGIAAHIDGSVELHPTTAGDYDADGITDLTIKFGRVAVMVLLNKGEVTLTITGEANDTVFEDNDKIRVIGK